MPFKSEAQRRWMHANEPEMADEWEKETPKGKLPERVKRKKTVKKESDQDHMAAMMEDPLGGAGMAQGAMSAMQTDMPMPNPIGIEFGGEGGEGEDEGEVCEEFSAEELKLGERYIELAGGVDRARELLDKVEECGECVGLADDESDEIEGISDAMPGLPDLPTDHFNGF